MTIREKFDTEEELREYLRQIVRIAVTGFPKPFYALQVRYVIQKDQPYKTFSEAEIARKEFIETQIKKYFKKN